MLTLASFLVRMGRKTMRSRNGAFPVFACESDDQDDFEWREEKLKKRKSLELNLRSSE